MIRTQLKVGVISFLIGVSSAYGGQSIRNGGDAVICNKGLSSETVELLDYYEAKQLDPKWKIDLGPETLTVREKLDYARKKLGRFSPRRAAFYAERVEKVLARLIQDSELLKIDDLGGLRVQLGAGCELAQLAIQTPDAIGSPDRRIYVESDLFSKLSRDHQAGLILHEVLYAELIEWGSVNSAGLRPFNAALASDDFNRITFPKFIDLLAQSGFATFEYWNLLFTLTNEAGDVQVPSFYPSGALKEGYAIRDELPIPVYFDELGHYFLGKVKAGLVTFFDEPISNVESFILGKDVHVGSAESPLPRPTLPRGCRVFLDQAGWFQRAVCKSKNGKTEVYTFEDGRLVRRIQSDN